MKTTLATIGWEIVNHLSYSTALTVSDIHLFGAMKLHLGGQKFQTDDELKHIVLHWVHSQDRTVPAASIRNLPG
jgi:uncharacterized membrane protein